jgi:PPOX class probable F420-dependent enzyme
VAIPPSHLSFAALEFMTERHLATLTTLRADGSPHVVPVGFTWDDDLLVARVIASRSSAKVVQARAGRRAALSQVQARRWITLEGSTRVLEDPASVRDAEQRYAQRYRVPRENPERVVIVLDVDRGARWGLAAPAATLAVRDLSRPRSDSAAQKPGRKFFGAVHPESAPARNDCQRVQRGTPPNEGTHHEAHRCCRGSCRFRHGRLLQHRPGRAG